MSPNTAAARSRGSEIAARVALGAIMVVIVALPFAHSVAVRNVALAVALAASAFAWRALRIQRPPLLWFFAGLAVLGGMSLIWSLDPGYSRHELKSELLYPFVVFILAFAICRDRRSLLWCTAATAVAVALSAPGPVAVWLEFGQAKPPRALLYNGAGFYSTWLVIVYPFALALALWGTETSQRFVAGVVAVVALAAGVFTFNRSFPYVAAFETVLILGWYIARGSPQHRRYRTLGAGLAMVTVVAAGIVFVQKERLAALPGADNDVILNVQRDVRWSLWGEALERIASDPVRGAGFGRGILRNELPKRYGNTFLWHAHNLPLNWGLQLGIPGIVLILSFFGAALWHLRGAYAHADQTLQPYLVAAMVMVVGVFLKNQTDDLFVRQIALTFWLTLGAVLSVAARAKRGDPRT